MKIFMGIVLLGWLLLCELAIAVGDTDELIFVAAIVRHGARRMVHKEFQSITNDPEHRRDFGRLTNVGKHQLYLLGRQMAHDYMVSNVLLNPDQMARQIVVRSSGLNRTVESALSLLAGLYQPGLGPSLTTPQIENAAPPISVHGLDEIRQELRTAALPHYQRPVPLHTSTATKDYLFSPHTECPIVNTERKQFVREVARLNKKYADFYANLTKINLTVSWDTDTVYKLYDNYIAVVNNSGSININFTETELQLLYNITLTNNYDVFLRPPVLIKLLTHVIFTDIKYHFAKAVKDSKKRRPYSNIRRMALFQVSDGHIMALQKIFKWPTTEIIRYAAAVVFELHRRVDTYGNEVFTVEASYNKDPMSLVVDNVDLEQYLNFDKFLKDHVYRDEEEYKEVCYTDIGETYDREAYVALSIVFFLSLLALWVINWCILVQKKKEPTATEDKLEKETLQLNEEAKDA